MTAMRRKLEARVRRGSIFIEGSIAITIALVAMIAAAQLIAISVRQRHDMEQLRIATNELANVMEQLYASPWQELTDRNTDWSQLSPAAVEHLQEPRARVSIETVTNSISVKRCRVELSWIDRSGQRVEPIQLTAWRHFRESP